jgi:hypothetical protein
LGEIIQKSITKVDLDFKGINDFNKVIIPFKKALLINLDQNNLHCFKEIEGSTGERKKK